MRRPTPTQAMHLTNGVTGSADRLSLECIMRFDLPQLPFQGRNERVKIDVSYNGNEFMPCGQVLPRPLVPGAPSTLTMDPG